MAAAARLQILLAHARELAELNAEPYTERLRLPPPPPYDQDRDR